MAILKLKLGTSAQNDSYLGSSGAITVDADTLGLRVHDGVTVGGHIIQNTGSITGLQQQIDDLAIADIDGLVVALASKVGIELLGAADGIATLDANAQIPANQLPGFVDDILEFADEPSFPAIGEQGKLYVSADESVAYRWNGSQYVVIASIPDSTDEIVEGVVSLYYTDARVRDSFGSAGDIDYDAETGTFDFSESINSVEGQTGDVVLTKVDVELGNVENNTTATSSESEAVNVPNRMVTPANLRSTIEGLGLEEEVPGLWKLDLGQMTPTGFKAFIIEVGGYIDTPNHGNNNAIINEIHGYGQGLVLRNMETYAEDAYDSAMAGKNNVAGTFEAPWYWDNSSWGRLNLTDGTIGTSSSTACIFHADGVTLNGTGDYWARFLLTADENVTRMDFNIGGNVDRLPRRVKVYGLSIDNYNKATHLKGRSNADLTYVGEVVIETPEDYGVRVFESVVF